jgi:hypothetical protein
MNNEAPVDPKSAAALLHPAGVRLDLVAGGFGTACERGEHTGTSRKPIHRAGYRWTNNRFSGRGGA